MTKVCSKCGEEKELSLFAKARQCVNGRRRCCKKCKSIAAVEWAKRDPEASNLRVRLWKQGHPERAREMGRRGTARYRKNHPERGIAYRKNNAAMLQVGATLRRRKRRLSDPSFRVRENLSRRINTALKGLGKWQSCFDYIGCSIEELRLWLESKFTEGMSWANYGKFGWHIDHVIPCSAFDLNNPEAQIECFYYKNLQPLWWQDNIAKGGIRKPQDVVYQA